MKQEIKMLLAAYPAFIIYQLAMPAFIMQGTDPVIEALRGMMPFFGEFLGLFQTILVPIGMTLGELIIGFFVQFIPTNTVTGFAIYFIIFAAILMLGLFMNVIWRPKGYVTTEQREKSIQKAEKRAAKKRKGDEEPVKNGEISSVTNDTTEIIKVEDDQDEKKSEKKDKDDKVLMNKTLDKLDAPFEKKEEKIIASDVIDEKKDVNKVLEISNEEDSEDKAETHQNDNNGDKMD